MSDGFTIPTLKYQHFSAATGTGGFQIKPNNPSPALSAAPTQPGVLHTLVVNTIGSAGTVTLTDGWTNNTTVVGTTIAALGGTNLAAGTYLYDVGFNTGLVVTTGGTTAPDITISWL